jgi:hypothetical protein
MARAFSPAITQKIINHVAAICISTRQPGGPGKKNQGNTWPLAKALQTFKF